MGEWIEWKGGECPVAKNVMVECRYRGPPNDDQFAIYEMVGFVGCCPESDVCCILCVVDNIIYRKA